MSWTRTRVQHMGSAPMQRVSTHQLVYYSSVSFGFLLFIRFSIAFYESYAVIRSERLADQDLIELCTSGVARQSAKMRTACLDAHSENAAPIFMKALIQTGTDGVAWSVSLIASYLGWPAKAMALFLFVSVVAVPFRTLLDTLRGAPNAHPSAAHHTIYVLNGDEHCTIEDFPDPQSTQLDKLRKRICGRKTPVLALPWNSDEEAQHKQKWI